MSEAPKEYQHIEFNFSRPSGLLDGKSYEISTYLLVPVEAMPEFQKWSEAETAKTEGNPSGRQMYKTLLEKGALLHREDGPAFREVQKSLFDKQHAKVTKEEYWEKGVQKQPGAPRIRPLGKYTL